MQQIVRRRQPSARTGPSCTAQSSDQTASDLPNCRGSIAGSSTGLWTCGSAERFVGTDGDRRPPLYKWHRATEYTLLKPEQDTARLCGLIMRETCLSCGGATPANDTVRLCTMPGVAHTADRVQPHELRCLQFLTTPHACLFIRTQSDAPVVACDIASSETRMFRLSYTIHKDTVRTAQ